MAARKRNGATRTASATKSSSSTNTGTSALPPNKRRKPNTQPLGLKLLGENSDNHPIVRLYVGNILGRKPSRRAPINDIVTPVRHVDIGITDPHIPRKLLQVSRVTANTLELDVFFDQTEPNQEKATAAHRKCATLSADICKIVRHSKTLELQKGDTIVLEQHDVLQISKMCKVCTFSYNFKVLPVADETAAISPNLSMASSASEEEEQVAASEKASALQLELDRLEDKLGFRPYRPTRPMGSTNETKKKTKSPVKSPRKRKAEAVNNEEEEHNDDSDSEDEDEEQERKDPKKESTMHATLGNTYYKALRTSTPHFGSSLLSLVLQKKDFPTPHLLEDLVNLMTFGPTYHGDMAFMEGNRLQLAFDYVQNLLTKHPKEMGPRFLDAIARVEGADYWRLLLDQLTILPYTSFTASSDNVKNGKPTTLQDSLVLRLQQSLEMHAISLKFFLLLLGKSEMMMSQVQRDSKEVTRHVSQVMAHVWVSRGYYLLEEKQKEEEEEEGHDPLLAIAMEQVTRLLTQVLGQVTNFGILKEQDLVDVLWSAMDERFRQTEEEEAKANRRKVLLTWVLQLEDLHTLNKKWATITDGLVKRARLRKEYNAISKV